MKEVISGVVGAVLTAAALWLLGKVGQNVLLPAGAIVGVAGPCPRGWVEYDAAKGKYLLGADGKNFVAGTSGGSNTLPFKYIGEVSNIGSSGEAVYTPKTEDYGGVKPGSGGRTGFPIQPEYVALTMCQK